MDGGHLDDFDETGHGVVRKYRLPVLEREHFRVMVAVYLRTFIAKVDRPQQKLTGHTA